MAYSKTTWEDLPSTNTPLNASNLNKIENELEQLDTNTTSLLNLLNNSKIYNNITQISSNLNWSSSSASDIFANMQNNSIAILSFENNAKIVEQLSLGDGGELVIFKSTAWRGIALLSIYHNNSLRLGYVNSQNTLSWRTI